MGPFEIVTIVVVGIAVVGVLAYLICKKVKGESVGCDCGSCSACPHCNACRSKAKQAKNAPQKSAAPTNEKKGA